MPWKIDFFADLPDIFREMDAEEGVDLGPGAYTDMTVAQLNDEMVRRGMNLTQLAGILEERRGRRLDERAETREAILELAESIDRFRKGTLAIAAIFQEVARRSPEEQERFLHRARSLKLKD